VPVRYNSGQGREENTQDRIDSLAEGEWIYTQVSEHAGARSVSYNTASGECTRRAAQSGIVRSCSCSAKESVGDTANHQDDVFDVFLAQEYQAKAEGENGEPFTDNVSGADGGPERHGHLAQRSAERYREALSDNEPVHEELRERASRRTTELMGAEEKVVAKRMIVDNDGEEAEKDEEFQPAPWTIAAIAWVDTEPLVSYHDNDVNSSDIPCVEYKDGKYHSERWDDGPVALELALKPGRC